MKESAFMKLAFLFLSLVLGFSASAADRKIGNVIVVERDIENIFDRCMDEVNKKPAATGAPYLSCYLMIINNPGEILLNKGPAFRLSNLKCEVDSEFGGGGLLINFNAKEKGATKADATRCLRDALTKNNDIIATIQTIE